MKHVIIGSGVAGMTAALDLAKRGAGEIDLYTDEVHSYYYRPQVTNFLAGVMSLEKVLMRPLSWYEEKGVHVHLQSPVVRLEPGQKQIVLADGTGVAYDRLLLAAGSRPFVPPVAGVEKQGVFTIRTLKDALAIQEYAAGRKKALVVGGGLLGLEAARGLQGLGLEVVIVEFFPQLMAAQLDEQGAAILKEFAESQGYRVVLGTSAQEILGEEKVTGVMLKDGQTFDVQMVVVATGVRSNIALAQEAGLQVDRGVIVDGYMRTSAPDIYAAGDVASFEGRIWAIVPIAQAQARVAAANMAGESLVYEEVPPSTTLKVVGIEVSSFGEAKPKDGEFEEIRQSDPANRVYKKIVLRDGKIVGAIVIGDKALAKTLESLIEQKAPMTRAEAQSRL